MRTVVLVGLSAFMIIASLITARGEESTWVVLATGELDSRVQHNLEQLAAHDHALIRIFSKTSHATHVSMGRGSIWIELRQKRA